MTPPGIEVLIHIKPTIRKTWGPHCEEGWCIGPASSHHKCYKVYMRRTKEERITDTIKFSKCKQLETTLPIHKSQFGKQFHQAVKDLSEFFNIIPNKKTG